MFKRSRVLFIIIVFSVLHWSCHNGYAPVVPINDFFKTPEKNLFKISPDGRHVAYLKSYKERQNLFIRSLDDGQEQVATTFDNYSVHDYYWTFNNQIIFTQDIIAADEFNIYALDVTTLKVRKILSEDKVKIRILNRSRFQPDIINIAMNKRDPGNFDIYKLNTRTGELTPYLINPGNITEWYPDADGKIRLARESDGVNESILFRPDDSAPFKAIIINNFKNRVQPIAFSGVKNYFYALSNVNRDKTALVEINAEDGKEERVVYANDKADIIQVGYSKVRHRLDYATWDEALPQIHFLNKDMENIYNNISQKLKCNVVRIVDKDTAEKRFIINTYTDRDPGSFYLYERDGQKLTKLGSINTGINPADMCPMKPISYKASDGTLINGYLTMPKGRDSTNLPVVVMPHDWPYPTSRNSWGFNPEVQFLANRGYAVFQVNYRGSTGYGKAFRNAGFKQAGGKIQQDITDGTHWLIDNKIADPKKIAIFGGGFGGFSALYGVSFHPGLYNCAVVQYGLINFFTYIKDAPPYLKPMLQMMYEMVGNPETDADQLRAISPVFHPDKIKVPLMIFQGAKDPRANISELNQFVIELKKRNVPVYYFLKDNERAYFRNDHNRMEMYSQIEKFLNNNMRVKP
jgi:dipeptidyl aminopeptidase/acylaminoacyl peptidase